MSARPKVVLTRRWPAAVEAQLAEKYDAVLNTRDRPFSEQDMQDAIRSADAVLPTVTDKLSCTVLSTPELKTKLLANYGVGFSHIDVETAKGRGLVVTNTPDVLSECTADITLTLMLMIARRAAEGEREIREGRWDGWRPTHLMGTKVSGKTLGIIGFGRIGQEVARRAHHGFGMKILVQNRSQVDTTVLAKYEATQLDTVEDLLPQADFVSLHCPGGTANRHLMDARRFGLMKEGAFLINTARGEVVDEAALIQALTFSTIGGVGLDVFDGEPRVSPELRQCDNAVLLPHLGSATTETREAMGRRVLENVDAFFEGRAPRDRVA